MTQITGLTISGSEITITYNNDNNDKRGLLSETAFKAAQSAGKNLNASGPDTFRSIGYFGIGFGGNMKTKGQTSQGFALNDMDLTRYTHINVAFLAITKSGALTIPNSFSSQGSIVTKSQPEWLRNVNKSYKNKHTGDPTYSKSEYVYAIFDEINTQRNKSNNPNVKIMPCIGGWNVANNTDSGFSSAVTKGYGDILHNLATEIEQDLNGPMYKSFKHDLQYLSNKGWADGVDIDWEYPGRPPIASMCKDNKETTARPCKVSEPTQIGPCHVGTKACVSFSYDDNALVDDSKWSMCKSATYRLPISNPNKKDIPSKFKEPTYYSAFIKAIKRDIKASEVSIALAGAPWGLHWYANTAATLIKSKDIDFANIMAYDYNGFWGSGQVSGFLSNMTNMNTLKRCNQDTRVPRCNEIQGCKSCFHTGCPTTQVCGAWGPSKALCVDGAALYKCKEDVPDCTSVMQPLPWNNCIKSVYIKFNMSNNLLSVKNEPTTCPLIMYNQLGASSLTTPDSLSHTQDVTDTQMKSFWETKDKLGYWFDDNNDKKPFRNYNPYMTLSILTMLNILTNVFGIDKDKLVLGLPYYGRTFQTNSSGDRSFKDGSYGLYQPYEYGTGYSYSDIHETYYKVGAKKDVYTIVLDKGAEGNPKYTEDIVYTKSLLSKITNDMTEEMISYNSAESITTKVNYAALKGYGGYMCWHMLSDYYE